MRARVLAPVALLAVTLPACLPFPISETERFTFEEQINLVVVDIDSGKVEIVAADDGRITIERTIRFSNARPELETVVQDGALRLTQDCPRGGIVNLCEVEYLVRVPAGVKLQAQAGSGDFEVAGLEGPLELFTGSGTISVLAAIRGVAAETGSGDILLEQIAGGASAFTGSGSITLRDVEGDLALETSSGNIEGDVLTAATVRANTGSGIVVLTLLASPNRLEMETSSGRIEASLPGGAYQLETQTGSGSVQIDNLINDPTSPRIIRARTGSGNISLRGK
jgi:hypothetical protein